ncbi:hypothetical protein [Perlabentimonas gracilis]|uniref:hypothetical protein n=1 Tax=Perlabentimonas gracilis TaxID=2715279 RepID=UPI001408AB12|nr:hypothetical protein [Perlabentimonas gracilis]NHB68208.1 hypothetical protein [Perlabentimonas gracilis]
MEGKPIAASSNEADQPQPIIDDVEDEDIDVDIPAEEEVLFSQVDLERHWQQFIESHLLGKPRFISLLTTYQPVLASNFQVKVVFEAQLQLEMFAEVKNELTHFLRSKLGSKGLVIEASFQSQGNGNGNGKIYTVEDRFKFLSQKNPKLLNLKQQLNLDFD